MKQLPFILLSCVAACIAAATFVEARLGTSVALSLFYESLWFRLLWALLAVLGLWTMWRERLYKRFTVCLLHLSLAVMLTGALLTALTRRQGQVHLRQHQPSNLVMLADGQIEELPFTVELDTFYIRYYPGTDAPSDYVSRLHLTTGENTAVHTVSMNHIQRVQGYRLFQTSFDLDLSGTILTATFDPYGTLLTYTGYLLFTIAALLLLLNRRETFLRLLRHPLLRQKVVAVLAFTLFPTVTAWAAKPNNTSDINTLPAIPVDVARQMQTQQVVYNQRIAPFNTLALDFLKKLYGRTTFHGLTAEQVVLSWQLDPQSWHDAPILQVKAKHKPLLRRLQLTGNHLSLSQLYDKEGNYLLQPLYLKEIGTHSALEKAILDLDEKVGIIKMLETGTLIRPIPNDGTVHPLSATKVKAELLYNSLPVTKILFIVNLTMGFILFFILLYRFTLHPSETGHAPGPLRFLRRGTPTTPFGSPVIGGQKLRAMRSLDSRLLTLLKNSLHSSRFTLYASLFTLYASLLLLASSFLLRWYISGVIPLTNGYETMQFAALLSMLAALLMSNRGRLLALDTGFLISGFTLLVSHITQQNPQITTLMPVLQSPWLSSHVSLIMLSYTLFAFITLNALFALALLAWQKHMRQPHSDEALQRITLLSRLLHYPALLLLSVGIFLGAVWANQSWGSYWSWDPKESWALITMMVYSLPFHRQSLPWLRRPMAFHLYMLLAFCILLMTYFGVNYLLGGMHSYA